MKSQTIPLAGIGTVILLFYIMVSALAGDIAQHYGYSFLFGAFWPLIFIPGWGVGYVLYRTGVLT